MARPIILATLLLMLVALQYALWAGKHNIRDLVFLQDQLTQLEEGNKSLLERNDELHAEVNNIKYRTSAIEARARSELGFIKKGETFFHIVVE